MLGCFQATVGLNVQPNLLGINPTVGSKQPISVFAHILPSIFKSVYFKSEIAALLYQRVDFKENPKRAAQTVWE